MKKLLLMIIFLCSACSVGYTISMENNAPSWVQAIRSGNSTLRIDQNNQILFRSNYYGENASKELSCELAVEKNKKQIYEAFSTFENIPMRIELVYFDPNVKDCSTTISIKKSDIANLKIIKKINSEEFMDNLNKTVSTAEEATEKLFGAIAIENYDLVDALISMGADVNFRRRNSQDLTLKATIIKKDDKEIKAAEEWKERQEEDIWTPLQFAIAVNRKTDIIKLLVKKGAEVNLKGNGGKSPLHIAADYNASLDIINFLIKSGAEINIENDHGQTPLMYASLNGHLNIVKELLKHKSTLKKKDNHKNDVLSYAIYGNQKHIVKYLLKLGWNVNDKDCFYLHIASDKGYTDIAKYLIEYGANTNIKNQNNEGTTPIMLASGSGHLDIVKILFNAGAKLNLQDNFGSTALMYASFFGHFDIVKFLVEAGAKIDMQMKSGDTALHVATASADPKILSYLISAGANFYIKNKKGWRPIDSAAIKKDYIKQFIFAGGKIDRQTLTYVIIKDDDIQTFKYLYDYCYHLRILKIEDIWILCSLAKINERQKIMVFLAKEGLKLDKQ